MAPHSWVLADLFDVGGMSVIPDRLHDSDPALELVPCPRCRRKGEVLSLPSEPDALTQQLAEQVELPAYKGMSFSKYVAERESFRRETERVVAQLFPLEIERRAA